MIPDFKTYLKESVCADIHKRSNGEQVRKEDDINKFNRDEMLEYIYSIYDNNPSIMANAIKSKTISGLECFEIPIFLYGSALYRLCVQYKHNDIYRIILKANKVNCEVFYDDLKKKFGVTILPNDTIEICRKNITKISYDYDTYDVTNTFVMEVIEFIIDEVSTKNQRMDINFYRC